MNLSEAARLFLMRQAQQAQTPQAAAPVQRRPAPRLRPPVVVQPVPPVSGDRPGYEPSVESAPAHGMHTSSYGHGDEQWPRCSETVHAAGMIHCGFRPLTVMAVDTSKPADIGLAYLDLGPFMTRHLSRLG